MGVKNLTTLKKGKHAKLKRRSTAGLRKIDSALVKKLTRTAVPDMRRRLTAMHRALACMAGLNQMIDGHHAHLTGAVSEALKRKSITEGQAKELLELAREENCAKHESLGHDPNKEPSPWFFFKDEDKTMQRFLVPAGEKMTPLGRFDYQHGPFRYIVQIHQDGDTGYQQNSQTGKVRQLVRGMKEVKLCN